MNQKAVFFISANFFLLSFFSSLPNGVQWRKKIIQWRANIRWMFEPVFVLCLVIGMIVGQAGGASFAQTPSWLWAKKAGGSTNFFADVGSEIFTDAFGNSYVIGFFRDTAYFDSIMLISDGDWDAFVAKYDAGGNCLWAARGGGVDRESGWGITVDALGNSYITGVFYGTSVLGSDTLISSSGSQDIFVAKFDAIGNILWAKQAGGDGDDVADDISVDASGNCYVTGSFRWTAIFGNDTLNAISFNSDLFVAKYDSTGNLVWVKQAGGTTYDSGCGGYGIATDNAGNSYVTGQFMDMITLGSNTFFGSGNEVDVFVAKYDASGNVLWAKQAGGGCDIFSRGISIDTAGNCFVTGYGIFSSFCSAAFGAFSVTSPGWDDNVFVAKYDNNGNEIWAKLFGGSSNDEAENIGTDISGNSYFTGNFSGTIVFGSDTLVSGGVQKIFVAKYDAYGNEIWAKQTGFGYGFGVSADDYGNVYATGLFGGSCLFDTIALLGNNDIFVAKIGYASPPVAAFTASDTIICVGDCINFTDQSTGSPATWNWLFAGADSVSSSTQNPANICYNTAGNYSVTLISANNYGSDTTEILITVNAAVFATITGTTTLCSGDSSTLTAGGGTGFLWSTGAITSSITVGPATDSIYSVTVTDNGCSDTANITLFVLSVFQSTVTTNICEGDSIFLSGNWQSTSGIYYDTLSASNGCDSVLATTLTVNPTVTATAAAAICSGDSIFLANNWQKAAGTFNDTLTAINGCDSVIATTLSFYAADTATAGTAICFGDSAFLSGSWQTTAGTYFDTLISVNGCDSIIQTILTINAALVVLANSTICQDDSIFLGGGWQTAQGTFYDTLQSSTGCDTILQTTLSVNQVSAITVNRNICMGDSIYLAGGWQAAAGDYYDTLPSVLGCDSIVKTKVVINPLPVVGIGNDTTIQLGSSIQLNLTEGFSFLWSPSTGLSCSNCSDPVAAPASTVTYLLTVTDANGCMDMDSITISVDNSTSYYVPNIFSPNNDGLNDFLYVRGTGIKSLKFAIYDRWGEKVFETFDKDTGWDGSFRGKQLNDAVFVYFLHIYFINNDELNEKGNITLIR